MDDPTRFLTPPSEPDASQTNGFVNPLNLFDYISPSAWIKQLITEWAGFDPLEYAIQTLTGEWDVIWQFGDVMNNLAQFMQELGEQVQAGAIALDQGWDGNAADAANDYFTTLAVAISRQQDGLYRAAEGYHKASSACWMLTGQIANLLQAAADEAIIAGLLIGAGTATIETGVGAFVGYGLAGVQIGRILEKISKASEIINTAGTVIMGAFGGVVTFADRGGNLSSIPLPDAAYKPIGA